MYSSYLVTVTSTNKTTPLLIFGTPSYKTGTNDAKSAIGGSTTDPLPVQIQNLSATHTILLGSKTKTTCVYPLKKGSSISIGVIGEDAVYARLTGTVTVQIAIIMGRQK